MSLDYNIGKVKDWETDPIVKRYTECMVFATMTIDLGRITVSNVDEWLFRIEVCRLINTRFGSEPIVEDGKVVGHSDYYPTREHVEKFIGMNTNVCDTTRTAFMKKISAHLVREAANAVQRERFKKEREEKEKAA